MSDCKQCRERIERLESRAQDLSQEIDRREMEVESLRKHINMMEGIVSSQGARLMQACAGLFDARIKHHQCNNGEYDCLLLTADCRDEFGCTCGAKEHNAKIDRVLYSVGIPWRSLDAPEESE